MPENLEHLSPEQLRQLRPQVGDAMQEQIDRLLGQPAAGAAATNGDITSGYGESVQRMNKTEQRMAEALEADPDVDRFVFEGLSFKIADGRRYRPDFYIVHVSGETELREVKRRGMWQTAHAASRVRFDVARDRYPEFTWSWYEWNSEEGQWHRLK